MTKVIKLRKGLDIHLKGKAEKVKMKINIGKEVALCPDSFPGIQPKVVVKEGEHVKAGEILFVNKQFPSVGFSSPVSGNVSSIVRGERRKVLQVVISLDENQEYVDFGVRNVNDVSSKEIIDSLLRAGLFGYINQLPYAISTNPDVLPKGIFISALRDKPLACDFEYELTGNEIDFQTGLTALSRISKTYLGIGRNQCSESLRRVKDVEVNIFDGPCPAGNVGVQIHHVDPINKDERVWTVNIQDLAIIGRLLNEGRVDRTKVIAVAGSEVKNPQYYRLIDGAPVASVLKDNLKPTAHNPRIISGNVLTGRKTPADGFIGFYANMVTVIPEGNHYELLGWAMPRLNKFSVSRAYFSWLCPKKVYDLDTNLNGGERPFVVTGLYDKYLPMDIYPTYLLKAILAGDIDKMENLGIYEVVEEDFALCEFVDPSKIEMQQIIRDGINLMIKEA